MRESEKLLADRDHAERNAWNSLGRYKFMMFGYWAAVWVHLNRIGGFGGKNPFAELVMAARGREAAPVGTHEPLSVAIERIHAAGGKAWDAVEDPDATLREIRGGGECDCAAEVTRLRGIIDQVEAILGGGEHDAVVAARAAITTITEQQRIIRELRAELEQAKA